MGQVYRILGYSFYVFSQLYKLFSRLRMTTKSAKSSFAVKKMFLLKRIKAVAFLIAFCNNVQSQTPNKYTDTIAIHIKTLPDVTLVGRNSKSDIQQMPEIVGTSICAGKKNSLIVLDNVQVIAYRCNIYSPVFSAYQYLAGFR